MATDPRAQSYWPAIGRTANLGRPIHDALCSACDPSVGTGITIRTADLEKVIPALIAAGWTPPATEDDIARVGKAIWDEVALHPMTSEVPSYAAPLGTLSGATRDEVARAAIAALRDPAATDTRTTVQRGRDT